MSVYCEINLFKPPGEVYQPGEVVAGVIKYVLDEPIELQNITTSLKGHCYIILKDFPRTKHESTYESMQEFVDIDSIILNETRVVPAGAYEIPFSYTLPHDIPSTLRFCKKFNVYKVICFIRFYIRIKFEKSGIFVLNKHFRKEIPVISGVFSRLSREPIIYGESKKLLHLFSTKDSIVNIKAVIQNSALPFNATIELNYEVENKSHVVIKSITTKLVEQYIFKAEGYRKVNYEVDVPGTEAKTTAINCKDTLSMPLVIKVPSNKYCIEDSWIVFRHYLVRIKAELPMPHKNFVLDIPVQIGVSDGDVEEMEAKRLNENMNYNDTPPLYWNAMGETRNEYGFEDDEDYDDLDFDVED